MITVSYAANDNVTIDVNVSETSSIIVIPSAINWTGLATSTEGSIRYLTIKNSGSLNVSQIYAYIDTLESEQDRPYGTGDPIEFSAGSLITIRNETDAGYYFAGRLEWNWTQQIPNSNWAAVNDPMAWGYFRNTSSDYVWVLGNGSSYGCNDTDAEFAIEDDIDLGIQDTRTPDDSGIGAPDATDANYGYFSDNRGSSPLNLYCIAAAADCSKIYIYHYDQRPGFNGCGNSAYIQESTLTPGNTFILDVKPYAPSGIPSGDLNQTMLTVWAT
ncbi:MAG: hypothetical protein ACXABJ_10230 [Candidatus Heimdallarchaeaceae archaeon]